MLCFFNYYFVYVFHLIKFVCLFFSFFCCYRISWWIKIFIIIEVITVRSTAPDLSAVSVGHCQTVFARRRLTLPCFRCGINARRRKEKKPKTGRRDATRRPSANEHRGIKYWIFTPFVSVRAARPSRPRRLFAPVKFRATCSRHGRRRRNPGALAGCRMRH